MTMTTHTPWSTFQGHHLFLAPAGLSLPFLPLHPHAKKRQFTCEKEGSSQVLFRASSRGEVAQGKYSIHCKVEGLGAFPPQRKGYASLHVSVLSLTCPLGGSAVVLHTASCFLPLLLEKDSRPPKGVIPNAKQHWRQPSFFFFFFCLHVQLSLCHQSNPLVFPSLSHTHSFSRLHTISVPTTPITPCWISTLPVLTSLSTTKLQTGSTHSRRSGLCKHWWSSQQPTTNGWISTSHICHFIPSSSPVDTPVNTQIDTTTAP